MDFINRFLEFAYQKTGLKVLNDAARSVPAVRLAGAALILAMFAAAALAAFKYNIRLAVIAGIVFVVLIALVIILGAAANQGNRGQAWFFSWVIVFLFTAGLVGLFTSSFYDYPKPLNELLLGDAPFSLKDAAVTIERDADNNLIVTASGIPQQPYTLNVSLIDPKSKAVLGELQLPLRNTGDASNPTGIVKTPQVLSEVNCVMTLSKSGRLVDTRPIVTKIKTSVQE